MLVCWWEENEQEMENQKHKMSTNLFPSLIKTSPFFSSLTFFFLYCELQKSYSLRLLKYIPTHFRDEIKVHILGLRSVFKFCLLAYLDCKLFDSSNSFTEFCIAFFIVYD